MSSALTTPATPACGPGHGGRRAGQLVDGVVQRLADERLSFSESGNIFNGRVPDFPSTSGADAGDPSPRRLGGLRRGSGRPGAVPQPTGGLRGTLLRRHRGPFRRCTRRFRSASWAVEGPVTLAAEYTLFAGDAPQRATRISRVATCRPPGPSRRDAPLRPRVRLLRPAPAVPFASFRHGGTGAVELGARYSYIDLTSRAVDSGRFDRWSGAFSWFPTGQRHLEFNCGSGGSSVRDASSAGRTSISFACSGRSKRPAGFPGGRLRFDEFPGDYFSISSLRPSAAILMLAPFVSLFRSITTPLEFRASRLQHPSPRCLRRRRPRRHR